MKIIGIVCSPRQQGNTEFLVKEALTAAKNAGAGEVDLFSFAGKNILPCDACDCCSETGECIIDDDMQELYPKLLEADGIIVGTPVYFWGVSAQAKIFIDRTYCLASGHRALIPSERVRLKGYEKGLRDKAGGIIIVTRRAGATSAFGQISDFFRIHRMVEAGGAIAYAGDRGEASKDEQGLREVRWTGKLVARTINKNKRI